MNISSNNRRGQAFTLVELLVVIGIIALLISVLLPALNRVRESAKAIKCQSNLRQFGQAAMMYVGEFKGALPVLMVPGAVAPYDWNYRPIDGGGGPYPYSYVAMLRPYITRVAASWDQKQDLFRCPNTDAVGATFGFVGTLPYTTYHWNVRLSWAAYDHTVGAPNKSYTWNEFGGSSWPKITQVRHPAQKIMMGDASGHDPTFAWLLPGAMRLTTGGKPVGWHGTKRTGFGRVFFDGHAELIQLDHPSIGNQNSRDNPPIGLWRGPVAKGTVAPDHLAVGKGQWWYFNLRSE